MKTSEKKIEEENLKDSSNKTVDPYAVDFFGVQDLSKKNKTDISEKTKKSRVTEKLKLKDIKGLDWNKTLPGFTYLEADFSNQLIELPNSLNETAMLSIKKTFARFTQLEENLIDCEVLSVTEVNLVESLTKFDQATQVYLTVQSEPKTRSSIIGISADFASSLIDLVLGGKGKPPDVLRSLSTVEQTIVEFLIINTLGELNQNLENSEFRLQSVKNEVICDLKPIERGAEIILNFAFGSVKGIATLLLPTDFINALGNSQRSVFLNETPIQKYKKYGKIAGEFPLNVNMGETQVTANDLLFLERDDVILLENPTQTMQEQLTVFVGDGTNYYLKGNAKKAIEDEDFDVLSEEILLEVQEIFSEKDTRSQPKREKMDKKNKQDNVGSNVDEVDESDFMKMPDEGENETELESENTENTAEIQEEFEEEIDEAALESLENVMINLRVNLGGRRLSLSELQKIRVGQIIELGCRPNDPVEVVTDSDNRPIASGELIEIEGQIGVRLTKIFV